MVNHLRQRLESTTFPTLEAMMQGYAQAAAKLAREQFRRTLDFSSDSIERLDEIIVLIGESPELDVDFEARLWGSYLGEVVRRRYAGLWEMTRYPGGEMTVPAVEVRGSRVFPLMKIYRRLTEGEEDDLATFFTMITGKLGSPARVN